MGTRFMRFVKIHVIEDGERKTTINIKITSLIAALGR